MVVRVVHSFSIAFTKFLLYGRYWYTPTAIGTPCLPTVVNHLPSPCNCATSPTALNQAAPQPRNCSRVLVCPFPPVSCYGVRVFRIH